jgi:hypothetical protein
MADWERHYPYREPGDRFRASEVDDDRNGGYRRYPSRERRQGWDRNPDVFGSREWMPETATERYPESGYAATYYNRPMWSAYRTHWEPSYERSMGREAFEDEWGRSEYPARRGYGYRSDYGVVGRSRRSPFGYVGRGPKGYRPSDDRIRDQVNERLTMHPEVDASEVDVRVDKGIVTLTGTVEDRHAKRLAEDIAEDVFGVDDVKNELRVRHGFFSKLMGDGETEMEKAMETAERGASKTARTPR